MIWVFAETVDGEPRPVVLEILTKARSLGEVEAVALGPGASRAAAALGAHGAGKVYTHEDPAFRDILAVPAVEVLARLIERHQPELVLFGMTYEGRDIASRLSAKLGTALIANATDLERKDGGIAVISPVFGGTLLVTTVARAKGPALVLVRPKAFTAEPANGAPAQVETLTDMPDTSRAAARVLRREKEQAAGPRLEDAAVIVSGGRGLGGPENFSMLDELAAELGRRRRRQPRRGRRRLEALCPPDRSDRARPSNPWSTSRSASPVRCSTRWA